MEENRVVEKVTMKEAMAEKNGPAAILFHGHKDEYGKIFSNFSKVPVTYEGVTYTCSESAYQAQKTDDLKERSQFVKISGGDAKKLARSIKLRDDWHNVRVQTMFNILSSKFGTDCHLGDANVVAAETLMRSGDCLIVEDTTGWRDNTWGRDFNTKKLGKNLLGICLMLRRAQLTGNPIVRLPYNIHFNIVESFTSLIEDTEVARKLSVLYDYIYADKLFIR